MLASIGTNSVYTYSEPSSLSSYWMIGLPAGPAWDVKLMSTMEPEQMANVLRATVGSIDPQLPLAQVQSMGRAVSNSEAPRRFNTVLISAFAMVASLLAALGMYNVIAFSAALRVQEMAIRMARNDPAFCSSSLHLQRKWLCSGVR